ncbi:hypothetical protein [Streptomyces sp. NPDC058664]|uniref:hypothetical protein n=1 Tax=unclassified Streptomyces TaxID=2593676 RepID=UPI00365BBEE4
MPTSLEDVHTQQRQAAEIVRSTAVLRARAERAGRPTTAPTPAPRQAGGVFLRLCAA